MSTLTAPPLNALHADIAGRYAQMRDRTRVHERALFVTLRIPSELELQARWFAGDFGRHFVSTNGDRIEIVQFGVWNREAGPDAIDFFQTIEHPFWNFHYTLTSKASPKKMALIGGSRVTDILANVLFPFWAAHELKARRLAERTALDRICEAERAVIKSASRNCCNASFWKRSTPERISLHGRTPTRTAPDL